jgi:tRNA(His) guanylyltransferase
MTDESRDLMGDRMKAYEAVETERRFGREALIYARIDGRSFSNFTRDMDRPFDLGMTLSMIEVTKRLVGSTNAVIGYCQSDEISLAWECPNPESEPLFGGKVQKLTSVLASQAAAYLANALPSYFILDWGKLLARAPHFDCRVFTLPNRVEVANAFLWRAMDARKNAVSSACRAHYSAKQMHGADQARMIEMMAEKGITFEVFDSRSKWGTFVQRRAFERSLTPEERERIPEKHRPSADALFTRQTIEELKMPEFRTVKNRVEVIFEGVEPIV